MHICARMCGSCGTSAQTTLCLLAQSGWLTFSAGARGGMGGLGIVDGVGSGRRYLGRYRRWRSGTMWRARGRRYGMSRSSTTTGSTRQSTTIRHLMLSESGVRSASTQCLPPPQSLPPPADLEPCPSSGTSTACCKPESGSQSDPVPSRCQRPTLSQGSTCSM